MSGLTGAAGGVDARSRSAFLDPAEGLGISAPSYVAARDKLKISDVSLG